MSAFAPSFGKARAFFLRDLRMDLSYRLSFLLELGNVMATVAAFYFFAKIMGDRAAGGYPPFAFLLLGTAVNSYLSIALYCFSQGIRGSQKAGVLKMVLAAPITPGEFLLYAALYPFCRAAIDAMFYLSGGLLLGLSLSRMNLLAALVLFVLSVAAHAGIGFLSAAFTMIFKKGDPLVWVFSGLSWLLGGVFYPVEVLPGWLQWAAKFLPLSHALRGTRAAMLDGASVSDLLPEITSLALFLLITLPLGVIAFRAAVKRARHTGSLGHT